MEDSRNRMKDNRRRAAIILAALLAYLAISVTCGAIAPDSHAAVELDGAATVVSDSAAAGSTAACNISNGSTAASTGTKASRILMLFAPDEAYAADYITKDGFPESYKTRLEELHKLHPSWKFTPVET